MSVNVHGWSNSVEEALPGEDLPHGILARGGFLPFPRDTADCAPTRNLAEPHEEEERSDTKFSDDVMRLAEKGKIFEKSLYC